MIQDMGAATTHDPKKHLPQSRQIKDKVSKAYKERADEEECK